MRSHLAFIATSDPGTWLPIPLLGREIDNLVGLPFPIIAGIRSLLIDAGPASVDRGKWFEIIWDAAQLAAEGRARLALDIGWSPLELFGCGRDLADQDALGLAASVQQRAIVAVTVQGAIVQERGGFVTLPRSPGFQSWRYLWELAR